jgi:diaminopimelate decarboxylase
MSTITYKKNELYMEDVPLRAIAEKYGTPVYCYSATQIENNFQAYRSALTKVTREKNFTLCYAMKANSNLAVLRLLQKQGAGADIVSGGELQRALKAKIPAGKIVYSGVGKSEKELTAAISHGIFQINVESETELLFISKIARKLKKKARIAIRVNPDVDAKTHKKITTGKKENKFGIDIRLAPALYKKAKALPGLEPVGVAIHIGSQLTSLTPFKQAYTRIAELVTKLRKQGIDIQTVDLGGGIGIRYKDETPPDLHFYALLIRDIILPLGVHVILEPGRSIVGNAGVLLSSVMNIKHGIAKKFMIIDAAMNDLLRPTLYDAFHDIIPCRASGTKQTVYDIVGPVCETGDTFLVNKKMAAAKTGDLVAIMTSGAYGAVMSSSYNTRPPAPEVLVKGKKFTAVRKIQRAEDLIRNDIVPEWV